MLIFVLLNVDLNPSSQGKSSNGASNKVLEQTSREDGMRPPPLRIVRTSQAVNFVPSLSCTECSLRPGEWTLGVQEIFLSPVSLCPLNVPVPACALRARH